MPCTYIYLQQQIVTIMRLRTHPIENNSQYVRRPIAIILLQSVITVLIPRFQNADIASCHIQSTVNRLSKQYVFNAYISSSIYLTNSSNYSTFLLLQLPLAAHSIGRSPSEKKLPFGLFCGSVSYVLPSCLHGHCSYLA